ncbi:DUF6036 family nucleotidyltransferase [Thermodesulfobacteriota bacterium]
MEDRLNKQTLLDVLAQWNSFLKRKVHLVACGGTALTLLDVKHSTKDIDFMMPNVIEHKYLTKILKDLGYRQTTGSGWAKEGDLFIFDLFQGNRIHATELLESPLKQGNHILFKEFSHLYIGILNEYDLIASKLFRGSQVDYEDCFMLVRERRGKIDLERIEQHFRDLARYDVSEDRLGVNIDNFMDLLREEGLYG